MSNTVNQKQNPAIVSSPKEYFSDVVKTALNKRQIKTYPHVEFYLADLLGFFVDTRNLYDEEETNELGARKPRTLAEIMLVAQNSDLSTKVELLKKLGDRSLYISGFFGDSLNRSLVDVDYYMNMGVSAFTTLSTTVKENTTAFIYREIAEKFVDFVDVYTLISHDSMIKSDQGILRLYERYLKTGSDLAKDKLTTLGVIPIERSMAKTTKQS
jgi:hypothetical protein